MSSENMVNLMLAGVIVVVMLVVGSIKSVGVMSGFSEGSRTGIVTKYSKKGIFWKSWEGEMQLPATGENLGGVMWKFSSKEKVEAVSEAQKLKATATLEYSQWLINPWDVGSRYIVDEAFYVSQ